MKLLPIAALLGVLAGIPLDAAAQVLSRSDAARAGWSAIREGRNQDAANSFAAAIADAPRDPSLYLGAGLAAQLLGNTSAARERLERALELAPDFTAASLLLGDLLYRESDLQGAIAVYEAAVAHAPTDRTLVSTLARLRAEPSPEKGYFQSQSAHFTVLFDGHADEAMARAAVEILEAAYWRIGTALYTFPDGMITVVIYTEQEFRDTTRSPSWAAASYDGRIRVPMRGALDPSPAELERVLSHELTHVMIHAIAPRGVPTWLNEGLAVMFEPEGSQWAEATLQGSDERIPLDRLAGRFDTLAGRQARLAYAQSADAARRLFDEGGGANVVALLQDIARGASLQDAFERRLLTPYSAFVARFERPIDEVRERF